RLACGPRRATPARSDGADSALSPLVPTPSGRLAIGQPEYSPARAAVTPVSLRSPPPRTSGTAVRGATGTPARHSACPLKWERRTAPASTLFSRHARSRSPPDPPSAAYRRPTPRDHRPGLRGSPAGAILSGTRAQRNRAPPARRRTALRAMARPRLRDAPATVA